MGNIHNVEIYDRSFSNQSQPVLSGSGHLKCNQFAKFPWKEVLISCWPSPWHSFRGTTIIKVYSGIFPQYTLHFCTFWAIIGRLFIADYTWQPPPPPPKRLGIVVPFLRTEQFQNRYNGTYKMNLPRVFTSKRQLMPWSLQCITLSSIVFWCNLLR